MDLGTIVKVAHALSGVAFIVGLAGRWIVLGLSARAESVASMRVLLAAAAPFERLTIVGSALVLVLGIATALVQGRPFLGPLQGAGVDWLFVSVLLYASIIPLVPLVFLPRGRAFGAVIDAASDDGPLSLEVAAAFRDPVVRAAHLYELGAVTIVLVLMISKPF